jgi:hypothetical protein
MTIYIRWDRPRQWRVKLYETYKQRSGGAHYTLGIVAESADRAIEAAQLALPLARVESCHDCGAIDIVVDTPKEKV